MVITAVHDEERPTTLPPRTTPVPKSAETGASRLRVLVADDDELVRRSVERTLRYQGFEVSAVPDGNAAVQAMMHDSFDVVLSDVNMPGTSGVDLLRVLRAYDFTVPVVLMTGQPALETAVDALELGAAHYLKKPISTDELCKALEHASRTGGARPPQSSAEVRAANDQFALEVQFEAALASLFIAYQPIVSVRSNRVVAYEAQIRTDEPTLVDGAQLIEAAVKLDRVQEVGRAFRAAVAASVDQAPSFTLIHLSIHPRDLLDPEIASDDSPLAKHARRIVFDLHERSSIGEIREVEARIHILRFMGYRIAVDELGSGASGLESFARFEPELAKLDVTLVRDIHTSPVRQRIVRTIRQLCDDLNVNLVAKGVELIEERNTLRELGCDLMEGGLFAKAEEGFPLLAWT